jgi:predicted alpha/beta-fold hydrolase
MPEEDLMKKERARVIEACGTTAELLRAFHRDGQAITDDYIQGLADMNIINAVGLSFGASMAVCFLETRKELREQAFMLFKEMLEPLTKED